MNPTSAQTQLLNFRATVDAELASLRDAQPATIKPPWSPGDRTIGTVETALPSSLQRVRVDGILLQMKLPVDVAVGQRLQLEFISATPRLSFALLSAVDLPGSRDAQIDISPTARLLTEVLNSLRKPGLAQSGAANAPQPLLPTASSDAASLAQVLKAAMSSSGLFYESHQAQWAAGQRPVEDLLNEPQGRLSPRAAQDLYQKPEALPPEGGQDDEFSQVSVTSKRGLNTDPRAIEPRGKNVLDAIHPQALNQVRNQLDALDSRQVIWHGQLWPGQELEWRIFEPAEHPHHPLDEPLPWFTQVRLNLPRLGEITAELGLVGKDLRLRLTVGQNTTRSELQQHGVALQEQFSAAGLGLNNFSVRHDGS